MKTIILSVLLLYIVVSAQAQEYTIINGSDNITETVKNGLNSIPDLQVSGVSSNLSHIININHLGASFGLAGRFSISTLGVTMPDGKTFSYKFNGKDRFECNELPEGINRIGANAVGVIFSQATALGDNVNINNSPDRNIAFDFENKIYYGKITPERLNQYGSGKNKDGNQSYVGQAKDRENIMAVQPYASVKISGLSPNSYNGYLNSIQSVRRAYSNWQQLQKTQSSPVSTSNKSSTPASVQTQTGKTTTSQNKSSATTQNASSSNRTSNDTYDKTEKEGKTLQEMEYERQAYQRQQQEKLKQAVDPGGYIMEKSGISNYFDNEWDRLKREEAAKDAREEREWLDRKRRREEEEQNKQREYEENKRKADIFNNKIKTLSAFLKEHNYYTGTKPPNSSTKVNTDKLYYFAYYTDYGSHTQIENAKIQITNVFAIGRYVDGSWPLQNTIYSDLKSLVSPSLVYRGYFESEEEAIKERNLFVSQFKSIGTRVVEVHYDGKNVNTAPDNNENKVDFWGNPVKNNSTAPKKHSQQKNTQKKKLDYWGNPINN